ncbi:hypothetical protein Fmac_006059 [Flemingia macrophylla]|uniref:Glycosyltransferase n=1 Tax=Flemingia macrophylla TaxID=520843 RepID=A0ABD1N9N4_9FABA
MGSNHGPLHIFFFPFMAHGHTIPFVHMVKLFAAKGVRSTIITTPLNAPTFSKAIKNGKTQHTKYIQIQTIEFPNVEVGLPEGCEHIDSIPSLDLFPSFLQATSLLQEPFEQLLVQHCPNCVVADMFFPWATDSAAKFGIPRLVFHGVSFFALCASNVMSLYQPYNNTSSDSEVFIIPSFPGEIKMTRLQVADFIRKDDTNSFWNKVNESARKSYGVLVNSFYELEKDYADHYEKIVGIKAWPIGPLCLWYKEEKTFRGEKPSFDEHECLKWLDKKKCNSVVYVCFGSVTIFSDSQLREIAMGLEASGQQFIWVVGKKNEDGEEWIPDEGFEKRMEGKGLIIRGWAPQVLILEHEAIGAFVTHCGWNSTLEGVIAGVPMVTFPVGAEQFYNEKLLTEVLKIGVPVGVKKWSRFVGDGSVKWDAIEKAVKRVMAEKEAEGLRSRATVLAQMARRAVEEGGTSNKSLDSLVEELGSLSH